MSLQYKFDVLVSNIYLQMTDSKLFLRTSANGNTDYINAVVVMVTTNQISSIFCCHAGDNNDWTHFSLFVDTGI